MNKISERRTLETQFEIRSEADSLTVEGYASTFNQPYNMGIYTETVAPGAFRKTLSEAPDVRFLINHDGLPLARTSSGTLELSEDATGLHFRTTLDTTDPDVARLAPKMRRGDLTQCSFAFRTIKDEWSADYSARTMRELSLRDGDVSIVTYPANPTATAQLRAARDTVAAAPLFAKILSELGEGRAISNANMAVLEKILVSIAAADIELDQAQADLAAFMGVENPDDDAVCEPTNSAIKNGNDVQTPADDSTQTPADEPLRFLSPAIKLAAWNAAQDAIKTASRTK